MTLFMNFVRKNIEENRRNEREKRKTEKICELGVFRGILDFNIIISGLDFNILVRRIETRNFVHQV